LELSIASEHVETIDIKEIAATIQDVTKTMKETAPYKVVVKVTSV
jgi:hypothetical protein